MEAKEKSEYEVDGYRVKVIRREQQHGPDGLDVNVYDEPDGTLRDYSQFSFRIDTDSSGRAVNFVPKKGQGEPSETALRTLHEHGFDCSNYSLDKIEKTKHEKLEEVTSDLEDVYLAYKDAGDDYAAFTLNTAWNLLLWCELGDDEIRANEEVDTMHERMQELDLEAHLGNPKSPIHEQIQGLAERDFPALMVVNYHLKHLYGVDVLSKYQIEDKRTGEQWN